MHYSYSENITEPHEYRRGVPLWSLTYPRVFLYPANEHVSSQNHSYSDSIHPARDAERSLSESHKSLPLRSSWETEAPIGVFDSGAGGLTILSALRQELPHENYIYFGDTAHCPYGVRSDSEISDLSCRACQFFIEKGAKLIIVACNTASQAALSYFTRFVFSTFYWRSASSKPAARATKKGRVGVAATNQAAKALYLRQLIDEFAGGIEVYAVGCPELVTLVEQGELDGPMVEEKVQRALQPLLKEGVDVIVLGCTHFPALRPVIERITYHHVQVIDSGSAVARRTHSVLDTEALIRHVDRARQQW